MTFMKFISCAGLLICLMIFPACTSTSGTQPSVPQVAITATQVALASPPTLPPTQIIVPPTLLPSTPASQNAVISDSATVVKNFDELLTAFNQKLKTTGWIRTVDNLAYYDNIKQKYWDPQVKEEWYRFDTDGQLVEAYNWLSSQDGAVQQESIFQGGAWYNVTYGGPAHRSSQTKVDFTGGFADQLISGNKITQEAVRYHDTDAWRFSFEMNDGGLPMARAIFFDRESGLLSGNETYLVQTDGSLKLVSGVIYTRFEINADPPLDRFQQILEKAQKMH